MTYFFQNCAGQNDTAFHRQAKANYRNAEQKAMIEKLKDSNKIPLPARKEIMGWFAKSWDGMNAASKLM